LANTSEKRRNLQSWVRFCEANCLTGENEYQSVLEYRKHQGIGGSLAAGFDLFFNSKDLLFDTAYACADADLQELALLHYEKLAQIDLRHSSALNNLGVVYANLKIPNLAVKNYKSAMAIDETLAAANFAHILIDAGVFDEAEKVLKEAQTKKEVHQNVAGALVKLEQEKKQSGDKSHRLLSFRKING